MEPHSYDNSCALLDLYTTRKNLKFSWFLLWSNSSWQLTLSKERPGSILTETLKNWILISIGISKELAYYSDSKCISFIKFRLTHQRLRAWEYLLDFRKRGKHSPKVKEFLWKSHHKIRRIRESYFSGFKLLSAKTWSFVFFARISITGASLFFVYFLPGVIVSTQWS